VLNGQESASNPLLHIHATVSGYITTDSAKQKIRIFADTKI